jgi:hypothetical protein
MDTEKAVRDTSNKSSITAETTAAHKHEQPLLSTELVTTNVSGHAQELERQFGLLSICATGIVTGNTWTALGGAIVSPPLFSQLRTC